MSRADPPRWTDEQFDETEARPVTVRVTLGLALGRRLWQSD